MLTVASFIIMKKSLTTIECKVHYSISIRCSHLFIPLASQKISIAYKHVSDTVSFWGTTSDAKDNWNINSI
jgi:hypothetical protein